MKHRHQNKYQNLKRERERRGWSQADVADKIGSDPKTVGRWERGETFPTPYFRQKLVEVFGKNAEELGLLPEQAGHDALEAAHQPHRQDDWGEAPAIENFYGHAEDLAEVARWIVDSRCRMIVILGIGGIGKTTFATMLAKQIRHAFSAVFWRSLRNAPAVENILKSYFVSDERRMDWPKDLDEQITSLITSLRQQRHLLVLDNVESVLQSGQRPGQYLVGYEGYGQLFQRIGETEHHSCLLLTSREKPKEIARLEGTTAPVRSFSLSGLTQADGQKLLQDKQLFGPDTTWGTLVQLYAGNPLALKLVAEPIREVFGGDIAGFLKEEEIVFGDIHELLDQQFQRLSEQERDVMYWLAIEREGASLNEMRENITKGGTLLDVLDSLRRRSMIESSTSSHFSLQPAIMEYVTKRFVEQMYQEINAETIELFGSHALIKAQADDYVRDSQIRLILAPLAEKLMSILGKSESEKKLKRMLATLRMLQPQQSRYAAGNVLNLLVRLKVDLHRSDFSHLPVEQAYLQDVALPGVNFSYVDLATSVFTDTFSCILCVASSANGGLLAAGTTTGEVRLWKANDATPLFTCQGHRDGIRSVAFSPDGRVLASGSEDQTVRLWDTNTGLCLKTLHRHTDYVRSVAFSPDGRVLASGSEDQAIRLWDVATGDCLNMLHGHTRRVRSIAFSPNGKLLASGGDDQLIQFWDVATGDCLNVLHGHTHWVRSIAFSPTGKLLVSGSEDQTVRLWDANTGDCLNVLHGHTQRVWSVAASPDGTMFASGGDDRTLRLWDASTGLCLKVLQGHTNRIWSVAFIPGSNVLVSASEDDTMRFWEVRSGQCLRTVQARTSLIKSLAFSPDGQMIVSGSEDQTVRLWDVSTGQCVTLLHEHTHRVRGVAFSPDGVTVASGSEDETVRVWNAHTGRSLKVLHGHTHLVRSVAFSPDGRTIASGSHDQTVRLWNAATGNCLKTLREHDCLIWSVAFSPDGTMLASGGDDHTIRLWDMSSGHHLNALRGHTQRVCSIAFCPDGTTVASGSDDHTIRLWDVSRGLCLKTLQGHTDWVRSVAFGADGGTIVSGSHDQTVRIWDARTGACLMILHGHESRILSVMFSPIGGLVASGGDDGTIRLWEISTGTCVKILRSVRLYEKMNITHVRGVTEAQKATLKMLGALEDERFS